MSETKYSLVELWPDFSRLASGDITSPEGLSAFFVALLFTLALSFVVLSTINYFKANSRLKFYKSLISGLAVEHLLDKRRDLTNAALKNESYGRLWREFDESLVHIPQKQRLCNTLDAAHFFNTHTLARGLTENRLLAAVPGFLTAIGVIGTFAGLQLGLGPLGDLNPEQAKVDELTHGIFGMIGGASIAFMTSVWGVLTSVLFNLFEKSLERNIRASIATFQNEVDYLYPRITAEQSLAHIEDFTRQSNERLAELDEKIGHKMQEAMREASGAIREGMEHSLNSILGPAIEKLVDNAHSGTEKALESLLERFLEGVGSAGDAQKTMMEQAAKDIAEASGGMTAGLVGFASKLDSQIEGMANKNSEILSNIDKTIRYQLESQQERDSERQQALAATMDQFMFKAGGQMRQLAEQNATTMKDVQQQLAAQIEDQQGREIARQKILHDQLKEFQGSQQKVTESIDSVLESQKVQNTELITSLSELIDRFDRLSKSHENATESMQAAAADMKGTSNQLGILSSNLNSASTSLSEQIGTAVESASNISEQNSHTYQLFQKLAEDLGLTRERINDTAQILESAAEKAEKGLTAVDQHFNALAKSLQQHVDGLEHKVAELLSDYSDRVQSQTVARLNTWNEQTNTYIGSMTDAVRALSDVVDEIDGKVRVRQEGSVA